MDKLEQSVAFVSASFDTWETDNTRIEGDIKQIKDQLLSQDKIQDSLKLENLKLKESLIDSRCRSVRDNLIFTNIPESEPDSSYVECEKVLRSFIKDKLHMSNSEDIKFKHVHHPGQYRKPQGATSRPRPMIAKFVYTVERDAVKRAGRELKGQQFSIFEQFPEEVSTYRKDILMPLLREARRDNKKAHITVENRLQAGPVPPPYRAPSTSTRYSTRPHPRP